MGRAASKPSGLLKKGIKVALSAFPKGGTQCGLVGRGPMGNKTLLGDFGLKQGSPLTCKCYCSRPEPSVFHQRDYVTKVRLN